MYPGGAIGDVRKSSGMVGMKMREHHLLNVAWGDSDRPQLRANLVVRRNPEPTRKTVERMPSWMVATIVDARGLSGVYENWSVLVLNEPRIDRHPIRPLAVEQHVIRSRQAGAYRCHLRA